MSKYRVISGPYFPVFRPNTGKHGPEITPYLKVNLRVKSEYRKISTRNNSVFRYFSRTEGDRFNKTNILYHENPSEIYLFKVSNGNTKTLSENLF